MSVAGSARAALVLGRRALLAGAVAALLTPREARADAVDDVLRDVAKARAGLRTLGCAFTQERTLGLLATTVTSRGTLTMVRPDRLRWAVEPPDEAVYWVTPDGLAYRTPQGAGKAAPGSAGALGALLGDLLVVLGGDLARLRTRYAITADRGDGGRVRLTLVPKAPEVAKTLQRLQLTLAADLQSPERLVLEEPGDDRAVITFGKAERNVPVDAATMRP